VHRQCARADEGEADAPLPQQRGHPP
jgi:hypothetical protein